eukprot:CAMPEP_0202950660 /NCGR_PEP_ID=MMETSP1395-20130829/24486_1 /ASSEMBLY_ACC=CAM_ASM_000871 /TAXON_ID=5961 /ORGANISM="Blepharisma japonicum, Strain Stock R1072" /LENGTH=38 /DNA_ID= /DNA_START= /DNA_END= /DNA_ORIENTATION=
MDLGFGCLEDNKAELDIVEEDNWALKVLDIEMEDILHM